MLTPLARESAMAYHPLRIHPDTVARQQMLARLLRRCETPQRSLADRDLGEESSLGSSAAAASRDASRAAATPELQREE